MSGNEIERDGNAFRHRPSGIVLHTKGRYQLRYVLGAEQLLVTQEAGFTPAGDFAFIVTLPPVPCWSPSGRLLVPAERAIVMELAVARYAAAGTPVRFDETA